ncbi:DEAD/DEAH box helicase [Marinicella sp. W31]|uniref:DEAD/DEAH box helicase n=1 Tax=Marinicella sp. W31 TaxID=3023713 RepID=UPI0037565068
MTFDTLGLSDPILKAVAEQGYDQPSPIQAQAIPAVLKGQDVMAAAQTGTGKTAGFTLPLLERLAALPERTERGQARVLILTPTRELAAQVSDSVKTYSRYLRMRSTVVYGGVKIGPQINKLRNGVEVLVATPGRLLDLYRQKAVRFEQLEVLVLDEADRMLDMGFIHDIKKIIAALPAQRQTLMFSATFSKEIRALAKDLVRNPVEISVTPPNSTVKAIKQWICPVDKKQKSALLVYLINEYQWSQVLVFARTKHGANRLTQYVQKAGIEAAVIHGNKSQGARQKALREFKNGKVQVLVATDIAARGLDIDRLPQVVNLDLPNVPEDYVHRIGRTGRAGAEGEAISLVSADEAKQLAAIEKLIKKSLPRNIIDGFEPVHDVPQSQPGKKPAHPKKKRKPKAEHQDGQRSGAKRRGYKPSKGKPRSNNKKRSNASNSRNRSAGPKVKSR